jgi:AcrR family transcriptional regulator
VAAITAIAFRQIARDGFEGLRVRKVAIEAGISHATLLHYFPSKQSLVRGVVQGILHEFRGPGQPTGAEGVAVPAARTPAAATRVASPLDQLREEFEDLGRRMKRTPGLFVVLTELDMRARRDPYVAQALSHLYAAWRAHLLSLLRTGIRSGVFRPDLDAGATAMAMMIQIKAAGYHAARPSARRNGASRKEARELISHLAGQVERWVTMPGSGAEAAADQPSARGRRGGAL